MDYVSLEHALRSLTGEPRGSFDGLLDAGCLKNATASDIGVLLAEVAKSLSNRLANINFSTKEKENGGPHARSISAIDRLNELATDLQNNEPDSKEVVVCLAIVASLIISGLLDHIEGNFSLLK